MAINFNPSPADIAGTVQPPETNIRIAETPVTPAPTTPVTPARPSDYKKYKDIYKAYEPVQQFQQKQNTAINDRYATNAADIKNLFGTLTTMREQDKIKIQEQFVNTLVAQQNMLAGRTAEVRQSTQAGVDAAQQAESELGGPAGGPVTSLTRQAAERGIAQSNVLSTIWQNQMGSQSMNTQAAIQNQIAGYGGQQANITKELGSKREGQLMQIQAQQVEIDQKIAQAKADYDLAVKNNNAAAARDAANRAGQLALAKEQNRNQPKTYSEDLLGWNQRVADMGGNPTALSSAIDDAYVVVKKKGKVNPSTQQRPEPSRASVLREMKKAKNLDGSPRWNADDIALAEIYLGYTN
jgi:hypothetical protein